MACKKIIIIRFWLIVGIAWISAFEGRVMVMIMIRDWPVLKVLSNCGLRHQAQDQAEGILKLQRIPGWSKQWYKENLHEKVRESKNKQDKSIEMLSDPTWVRVAEEGSRK